MLNRKTSTEPELFRSALGPGEDCPPLEDLETLISGAPSSAGLADHVASCSYCKTELHLLQSFLAEDNAPETPEVRATIAQLQKRSKKIFAQSAPDNTRVPWWKAAITLRSLAYASFAMAMVLVVAGIMIHLRTTNEPTLLSQTTAPGHEVFRSGSFAVITPAGDLHEAPKEIRWESAPSAASYRVSLLEVDRHEVWKAETTQNHVDLPVSVRSVIVPAKTLFCEITAFDSSGNKVGATGLVRFRLLQSGGGG
ncbi:MAG TPA: hypothetical protein VJA94_17220 [Candidatus Angelobacter sp.]